MKMSDVVRQLLTLDRVNQESLAKDLGVTQATVSRWLGGADPRGANRDQILTIARKRGIIDIEGGSGRPKSTNSARFLAVPVISWVSAGRLADTEVDLPTEEAPKVAVADLGEGDFFGLRVQGTSMDRISPDKSLVVVNRRERALQEGKPYIFAVRGEATYKLWRASPARLEPYSTDPSNEPIFLDRRQSVTVIGRVRRSILDL